MSIGLYGFMLFCLWRGWCLHSVYSANGSNVEIITDFLYSILMIYLLGNESLFFLFIVGFNLFIALFFGMIAHVLPIPEDVKNMATIDIHKFWLFLVLRSAASVGVWILYVNY